MKKVIQNMPRLKKNEIYIESNYEDRLYLYVRHGIVALFLRKGSQVSYEKSEIAIIRYIKCSI